jgi:hypothetical protein
MLPRCTEPQTSDCLGKVQGWVPTSTQGKFHIDIRRQTLGFRVINQQNVELSQLEFYFSG